MRPGLGEPVWCGNCGREIVTAIRRLPELAAQAGERRDGRLTTPADPSQQRSGRGVHSPSGSPAWDTVDEAIAWAGTLRRELASELGQPGGIVTKVTPAAGEAPNLTRDTAYLAAWSQELLTSSLALEAGNQALSLAARLQRASGRDQLMHRLDTPCPKCKRRALQRPDGSDTVECRYCHHQFPWKDYPRLAQLDMYEERGRVGPACGDIRCKHPTCRLIRLRTTRGT